MRVVATIDYNKIIQALKIGQSHRSRDLVHFPIRSNVVGLIIEGEAKVLHQSHLPGQSRVLSQDNASFERIDNFRRVKTEYFGVAETANHSTFVRISQRARGIEKKLESASFCYFGEFVNPAGPAPQINADDAGRK